MEISEAIRTRRSIRRFKQDPIPEVEIGAILEAVRWSPSWGNTQCWEIVVVRDLAIRERLESALSKPNAAAGTLLEAPVVLGVCGRVERSGYYKGEASTRWGDWILFDCGIASQNICLTAHSFGLGTIMLGQFDHVAAEGALGIPEDYALVCLIPVGYPAQVPSAPGRKKTGEFVHRDGF